MALRVANMVEAQLPATPVVATFVAGMSAVDLSEPEPRQVAPTDMFDGALNAVVESVLRRSKKVQAARLKVLGEFDHCCLSKGANVEGLDEWFLLSAKYVVDPKCSTTQHAMEHGAQQKSRHTKLCNINLERKQAMS